MPFAAKTVNTAFLLWKAESTYQVFTAPSATTDGKELAVSDRYASAITPGYWEEGEVGPSPGNTGMLPRVAKQGKFWNLQIPMRFKGFGAAYSASNKIPMHDLITACGYTAVFSGGAGSEVWTFNPDTDIAVPASGSFEYYKRQKRYRGAGTLGSLSYESANGLPPIFTFAFKAVAEGDVIDQAVPAITYLLQSVLPPVGSGATITIGTFLTAVVKNVSYQDNRNLETARYNLNGASVHLGFQPGERKPMFSVTIEETALVGTPFHTSAGIDAPKLAEAANQANLLYQLGGTQYNRLKHNLNNAQLASYEEGNDGSVATIKLNFEPKATNPGAFGWSSIVCD